jgi:hypothetical protein
VPQCLYVHLCPHGSRHGRYDLHAHEPLRSSVVENKYMMMIRMTKIGPVRIHPALVNLPRLLLNLLKSLGFVTPFRYAILPSRAADTLRIGMSNLNNTQDASAAGNVGRPKASRRFESQPASQPDRQKRIIQALNTQKPCERIFICHLYAQGSQVCPITTRHLAVSHNITYPPSVLAAMNPF